LLYAEPELPDTIRKIIAALLAFHSSPTSSSSTSSSSSSSSSSQLLSFVRLDDVFNADVNVTGACVCADPTGGNMDIGGGDGGGGSGGSGGSSGGGGDSGGGSARGAKTATVVHPRLLTLADECRVSIAEMVSAFVAEFDRYVHARAQQGDASTDFI
jgi:hypothetical protein